MRYLLRIAIAWLALGGAAAAQGIGQLPSGSIWGNCTAGQALSAPTTVTCQLDRSISSTQGALLTRNATVWVGLAPGTTGLPLLSQGAAANLAYGILGLSGGGSAASLTASNGGIVYSTASALAILAGTATANQVLLSGSSTTPAWSTATYPATAAAGTMLAAGTANVISATATPTLGIAGSQLGSLTFAGNTSGSVLVRPQATAGSPTLTFPNASGTFAISASAPLALSATTGALTVTGAQGQVLAGVTPAFTATPTLGVAGSTVGSLSFENATSGSTTLRPVTGALGAVVVSIPSATGTMAVSVSAPLLLNATTGALSIAGVAGQVLAGATPAFTATPTLGASGTLGSLTFGNATSGLLTLQPVTGALGTVTVSIPAASDTLVNLASVQALTNKTYNALTVTSSAGTLTIANNASASLITSGNFGLTLTATGTSNATFPLGTQTLAALTLASQTISGGATVTSLTQSTGNITVDCGLRPLQFITNGGAYTITAPAADGSCMLLVTNNASAGATTFSGFTVGSSTGAALTTTNGNKFTISVWRINGTAAYSIVAHQ